MLVSNWRAVLCRAWSIRLLLLAGVLSGAEVALPLIGIEVIPPRLFAALSGIVAAAAFVARLLAQKGITDA
jgi:hypothetical protein